MKNLLTRIISLSLVFAILFSLAAPVYAADDLPTTGFTTLDDWNKICHDALGNVDDMGLAQGMYDAFIKWCHDGRPSDGFSTGGGSYNPGSGAGRYSPTVNSDGTLLVWLPVSEWRFYGSGYLLPWYSISSLRSGAIYPVFSGNAPVSGSYEFAYDASWFDGLFNCVSSSTFYVLNSTPIVPYISLPYNYLTTLSVGTQVSSCIDSKRFSLYLNGSDFTSVAGNPPTKLPFKVYGAPSAPTSVTNFNFFGTTINNNDYTNIYNYGDNYYAYDVDLNPVIFYIDPDLNVGLKISIDADGTIHITPEGDWPDPEPDPTPTPTATATPASTPTASPTASPSPTATATAKPSASPTPAATATAAPVPVPTATSPPGDGDDGISLPGILGDLLLSLLKFLWSLISKLLGFIIWLLSQTGALVPWIPVEAVVVFSGGVVIVVVLAIIKFIRG